MTCVVVNRAQLQKEKQLRENAEQQRQELEERLTKYQDEVERARKGLRSHISLVIPHLGFVSST